MFIINKNILQQNSNPLLKLNTPAKEPETKVESEIKSKKALEEEKKKQEEEKQSKEEEIENRKKRSMAPPNRYKTPIKR